MSFKKQKAFAFLTAAEMKQRSVELKEKYEESETKILYAPRFLQLLKRHIKPTDIVLDLGSANGYIFKALEDIGVAHTYGADIDNFLTKGKPTDGFASFDFNMDTYPYADGSFDAVTSIEVIEHLENPFHFVRQINRVLKQGGIFIFTTPNPGHLFNKIQFALHENFYRFMQGNDHITLLTNPILKKGILPYFDIVEIDYMYPEMPWRFLRHFRYPSNRHFGRSIVHVLRKK